MTTTSDRDAAISRLIAAVGDLRSRIVNDGGWTAAHPLYDVVDAYDYLVSIPLEIPTEPKTRTTAPLTAHWAARSMRNSTLHGRILRSFFRSDLRSIGWTVEELEIHHGVKHQTMSPRINELRNSGWIEATGDTRTNASGCQAEVYVLTPAGVRSMWEARREEVNP